ncbi:hypothetical protein [Microcoleus vaginatus]|uniref:hypothetical protein n=1 Tax=Microcoleus vaginatus TaxID=119532 RepID=UPI001F6074D7
MPVPQITPFLRTGKMPVPQITPFSRTGKMPVPQRVSFIVGWAEEPAHKRVIEHHKKNRFLEPHMQVLINS